MILRSMTERTVASLKHGKQRYDAWEPGRTGLGLRIAAEPSTRKVWQAQYWWPMPNGKQARKRLILGQYPAVGIALARTKWREAKALIDAGTDPFSTQKQQKVEETEAPTFRMASEGFMAKQAKNERRSVDEYQRVLDKDVLPAWGDRKLKTITRKDVLKLVNGIASRGAPVMANRTISILSHLFNYSIGESLIESNPSALIAPRIQEKARRRTLTPDEIRLMWHGHADGVMSHRVRLAHRFLLATAQRRKEVANARLDHIDEHARTWLVQAEVSKNGLPNLVPLSELAWDIYVAAKALAAQSVPKSRPGRETPPAPSPWLFPGQAVSDPITAQALTRAWGFERLLLKMKDVRVHDFRRTASTGLAALGVARVVRERILNHSQGRLDESYDVYEYLDEKRVALEKWSARLKAIIATDGEKVVQLQQRGLDGAA